MARNEDGKQVIGFTVGQEEYGVELQHVKEVIRMSDITRLPDVPSYVRGLINLRGLVIPIIDLREKMGLEPTPATPLTRIIVVEVNRSVMGMVVDSASQVLRLQPDEIEPAPLSFGGASKDYITNVGKLNRGLIVLMDVGRLLASHELERLRRLSVQQTEAEPALSR
ncbi:MAG TPA: chemotaxis protein CheW [Spirochaetia bacterium]|nr:chemotaxis protein CheW [Spirochaetia bacterium]